MRILIAFRFLPGFEIGLAGFHARHLACWQSISVMITETFYSCLETRRLLMADGKLSVIFLMVLSCR